MTPGKCMAIVQYGWDGADGGGEERMEKMTEVVMTQRRRWEPGPKGPMRCASHYEAREGGLAEVGGVQAPVATGSTMCLAGVSSLTLSLRGSPRRQG